MRSGIRGIYIVIRDKGVIYYRQGQGGQATSLSSTADRVHNSTISGGRCVFFRCCCCCCCCCKDMPIAVAVRALVAPLVVGGPSMSIGTCATVVVVVGVLMGGGAVALMPMPALPIAAEEEEEEEDEKEEDEEEGKI